MTIYETLNNGIKIVEYEPSLAQAVADMMNKSQSEWGGGSDICTGSQIKAQHLGASNFNVYLALDGNEVVGYCSLSRYHSDADTLYIPLLSVRPDYHGKKLGKALVLRCVARTMELGYPRIDLYTWSGNTAAVPLYKKCGYLWEDRPNSTHLINFIPSILTNDLFTEFFKKADWYADSTRTLEIVPDGKKVNGFEVFGYTWEKDGEFLAIGYERSGRQMRLVETNDYKIELMAEDHELAFGLSYNCTFRVENKTGRELHIKIAGREDKNITFDYSLDTSVTGIREYQGQFYVGAIDEPQDLWKIHPCLLADVEINGRSVAFGLGIETKSPLLMSIDRNCKVARAGMELESYIDIRSALLHDATVHFVFPENGLIECAESNFTVDIPAKGKASIPVTSKIIGLGYKALPVDYTIILKNRGQDDDPISFSKPCHFYNQGMTQAFAYNDEEEHGIINGPWRLSICKHGSEVGVHHLLTKDYSFDWGGEFEPPKFGKPYDDEFNLIKPTVKMYPVEADMVMEAEFISGKFPGMVLTQIFTLSASGVITRRHRIENRSTNSRDMMLNDAYWLILGNETTFCYKGQITQNHNGSNPDGVHDGLSGIDGDGFEENWVFEASNVHSRGYCWPPGYKPGGFDHGSRVAFEIDLGNMAPGAVFETEPVMYVYGHFTHYNDFRDFAAGCYKKVSDTTVPVPRVDVRLNGYNLFMDGSAPIKPISLEMINNRETVMEGKVRVSSPLFDTQEQINPEADEPTPGNAFLLPVKLPVGEINGIELINLETDLATYEKSLNRALFFSKGQVNLKQTGSVYSANNGKITFKVDPAYGPGCYSLTTHTSNDEDQAQEWLLHEHPDHKPFSWWNPFLGGIQFNPPDMNNITILKECIHGDFTEIKDRHGNLWQGIRTTLTIKENDDLKGGVYESYFVTLPGLPVLCTFFRFINHTGVFRKDNVTLDAFIKAGADIKDVYAELADSDNRQYRLRMGTVDLPDICFQNEIKITDFRRESLYAFHGNRYNGSSNKVHGNNKYPVALDIHMEVSTAPSKAFVSDPTFFIITEKDLPKGALDDLERITFTG